ncbi:hypothetical protein ACJJTC_019261 [Scirpophaga incertulas]
MKAGIIGKPLVFLFGDNQIMYEGMLEDINMLLNTGDIPNLYGMDEKVEILDKMQGAIRDSGKKIETTPLAMFGFYVERVKANLRTVLAMSPIGDSFRNRLRMFPSLVNCCTIDWFSAWPPEALERVASMFISRMEGIDDEQRIACVRLCQLFHVTVVELSDRFYADQRRKVYVTPTSYLELIKAFQNLYSMKVEQITKARLRYVRGLERLSYAAGQVGLMQSALQDLQPQLVDTSDRTEKLMIKIEQDTVVVEKQKEASDDCESDLAEAAPALAAALHALDTLKPADITLVKSMKNPPAGVKLVMEAVCVMRGVRGERRVDSSGRPYEDFWAPSLKLLGDMKFLETLKNYDKDNIPAATMKKIREKYIPDREFDPVVISKVSSACEGLCRWVRAMDVYDRVIKVVAPKKAALGDAESELQAQMNTLNEKRAQLQSVLDKLQALNDEFAEMTRKKKGLEDEIDLCSTKLARAEQLIGGLGGEKDRWTELAAELLNLLDNILGDVLLSAGFIAYLGPFTVNYRREVIRLWNERTIELNVPCSEIFSLISTLGEPVVIRAWNIAGLPVDDFSIENGIIVEQARRWPLMIDPQDQANRWIKNMERDNQLKVVKLSDGNCLRVLELAVTLGLPALLEHVAEHLDAALQPLLVRSLYRRVRCSWLLVIVKVVKLSDGNCLRVLELAVTLGLPALLEHVAEHLEAALQPLLVRSLYRRVRCSWLLVIVKVVKLSDGNCLRVLELAVTLGLPALLEHVVKLSHGNCLRVLELAVTLGLPALLEHVAEHLDAALQPLLVRSLYRRVRCSWLLVIVKVVKLSDGNCLRVLELAVTLGLPALLEHVAEHLEAALQPLLVRSLYRRVRCSWLLVIVKVVKLSHGNCLRVLELAVTLGLPALLEHVAEHLDAALQPLLVRSLYRRVRCSWLLVIVKVVKLSHGNCLRVLELAVTLGLPALLEHVAEHLDAALQPLLVRSLYRRVRCSWLLVIVKVVKLSDGNCLRVLELAVTLGLPALLEHVVKLSDGNCLRVLELAVTLGLPALLEHVAEHLDAALQPLLVRSLYRRVRCSWLLVIVKVVKLSHGNCLRVLELAVTLGLPALLEHVAEHLDAALQPLLVRSLYRRVRCSWLLVIVKVVKLSDGNCLRVLELAVTLGLPALLEHVAEHLDAALQPLLVRSLYRRVRCSWLLVIVKVVKLSDGNCLRVLELAVTLGLPALLEHVAEHLEAALQPLLVRSLYRRVRCSWLLVIVKVVKLSDGNCLRVLELAVTLGLPALLEHVAEHLDAALQPLLVRSLYRRVRCSWLLVIVKVVKLSDGNTTGATGACAALCCLSFLRSGGVDCLKLGDNVLEYNHNFRFYITTRFSNPHYLPEIAVKVEHFVLTFLSCSVLFIHFYHAAVSFTNR